MTQLNEIITKVKQKYAPDKRVAIFNVQAEQISANSFTLSGESNLTEAKAELLDELKKHDYKVSDKIEVLPSKELNDKVYGVINLSVANIRSNSEHSAEMATQALLGFPVRVYKKSHGWLFIQTPDKYISWTDADAVELMDKKTFDEWNNSQKVIYTAFYGLTYSKADESSQTVSDITKGGILRLIEEKDGFCKVAYPDNRIAFIPSKYCQKYDEWLNSIDLNADNLIKTAKTFMGLPYLWGGTSTKGVDCSGFTKSVYYLNGVVLPRDASQQVNAGDPVDTKDGFDKLMPGDLLFFGTKASATTKEKATHVGMYIGNGEFIHSSGRVRINSLDKTKENFSEYRFNTFLKARRILTSLNKNDVVLLKDLLLSTRVEK
ncbi:MAG: C40 family peptidase [Bacteroidota bacterium]|nr:C40 family peptidase [Bacteroidota bacterium]MDP4192469.1 C40 family peptidase [Bacteroidota bacterium]MDP4196713.1 C40 family peptidase [Bacteroidota bacterium]